MSDNIAIRRADDHPDVRCVIPVRNVFCGKHMSSRNGDRPDLVEGKQTEPELEAPLEDEHDGIAFSYAMRQEKICCPVTVLFKLTKSECGFSTFVITPYDGNLVRILQCHFIDNVKRKVEVIRYDYSEIIQEVFV